MMPKHLSRKSLRIALFAAACILIAFAGCQTTPKNVVLFIGDGMGLEQVKAAAIYKTGQPTGLVFQEFPYQTDMTTYSADAPITDSAASGTAMATGVKVNNGVLSIATPGDGSDLKTILEHFQDHNGSTGLVTTTYITHATPAAFGAHVADRGETAAVAEDLFTQTRPDVLFGAGAHNVSPEMAQAAGYVVVTDAAQLAQLDTETTTRVSGQFGSDIPYECEGLGEMPSLGQMTGAALRILDNNPTGFFLMVEGGKIDWAGHENHLARNVGETIGFDGAVQAALQWAQDRDDTLIVITADHETGGLHVTANNGKNVLPDVTWSTMGHTAQNVPVYATGPGAEAFQGPMDNTEIFTKIAQAAGFEQALLGGDRFNQANIRLRHALLQSFDEIALLSEASDPLSGPLQLQLNNTATQPLHVSLLWQIPDSCPWRIEQLQQELSVPAGQTDTLSCPIKFVGDPTKLDTRLPLPSAVANVSIGDQVLLKDQPIDIAPSIHRQLSIMPPTVSCTSTQNTPKIDATLDDPTWRRKPDIAGFVCTIPDSPPSTPTIAWVTYDQQALYLALYCVEPNPAQMRISATEHDGRVWEDDSVEIFIDTNYDRKSFFQIIINPRGVTYDGKSDGPWDGDFESAATVTDKAWLLEAAISWNTLGLDGPPAPGSKMGLNLVRNRSQAQGEITQWAPTRQGNWKPELFGTVEF